ncbi:virulence protein RhuM/Fic/DOC family protein [Patescibacteria group bacterium]|nr:virulence protein RhuM/Fic/DOC family protein [Patescibacteria group bacterium]MBU4016846.1 virulence protein RhuM/Fic/DOC family protein [Patescibacteria group bacterium]MBU4099077.1 virulence protein RhuM/Fic/DOC family protein [Patescibacteria group bacterium]
MKKDNRQIAIYQAPSGAIEARLDASKETIFLTQQQVGELFNVQKAAISKHVKNIFDTGELDKKSTVSILETLQTEGKRKVMRKIEYYNLDLILSIGYRVNSANATKFRQWATKTLRQYVLNGYAVNEKRILEAQNKFHELQEAVLFLQKQSKKELLTGQEAEILNLLADYSKTLSLLEQYDKGKLADEKGRKSEFVLKYEDGAKIIAELKKELIAKKEASDLFGQERGGGFEGIIKGLYQTFAKKELYPAIEDKAAHLLYLTVKDHPFSDGNKRTASFLFVYFLDKSNYLFKKSGERKINDNALTALALLIAESDPKEKEVMIKIVKNLLAE